MGKIVAESRTRAARCAKRFLRWIIPKSQPDPPLRSGFGNVVCNAALASDGILSEPLSDGRGSVQTYPLLHQLLNRPKSPLGSPGKGRPRQTPGLDASNELASPIDRNDRPGDVVAIRKQKMHGGRDILGPPGASERNALCQFRP